MLSLEEAFAVDISVNFGSAQVSGYQGDLGEIYGDRGGTGNGPFYGWSRNHTLSCVVRGIPNNDPLLDSVCLFGRGAIWEIKVDNGNYNVKVSIGDSEASLNMINVEGVSYWNAKRLDGNEHLDRTLTVTVSDGKLTLDQGIAGEQATRINYIEITRNGGTALPTVGDLATPGIIAGIPTPDLPPILTMADGAVINPDPAEDEDDELWYDKRAPELRRLLQHYEYGYFPVRPPIDHQLVPCDPDPDICDPDVGDPVGGNADYKEVAIDVKLPNGNTGTIYLSLYVPKAAKDEGGGVRVKPVPVFLGLTKCPNHTVTSYAGVNIRGLAYYGWLPAGNAGCYGDSSGCGGTEGTERGCKASEWPLGDIIGGGYAFASFYVGDVYPDSPNSEDTTGGIHAAYDPYAPGDNPPDDTKTKWAALAAWAWGVERVVDYLETDPDIDKGRIAVVGHSRRGKATLLAAAMDPRIALAIPHQSGTGGTSPSRPPHAGPGDGQVIKNVTTNNPNTAFWWNDLFPDFGGKDENDVPYVHRLPFDQHSLIALVAPRFLLDGAGIDDIYYGENKVLKALQQPTAQGDSNVYDALLQVEGVSSIQSSNCDFADPELVPNPLPPFGCVRDNIPPAYRGRLLQYRRDEPDAHTLNENYWAGFLDYSDLKFFDQAPYGNGGNRWPINDGTQIEAENFDTGGETVAYHDTTSFHHGDQNFRAGESIDVTKKTNDTDHYVSWTDDGEWLEYSVHVVTAGNYKVKARVASNFDNDKKLTIRLGGKTLGTVGVPNTGGAWTTKTPPDSVNLEAGLDTLLRLEIDGGSFKIDRMEFTRQ